MNLFQLLATSEIISTEEQIALITQYRETGDISARNKVIESNYRYIYGYVKRFRHHEFTAEEFFSYAVAGFAKAIDRYDLESGYAISTYANNWMHDEITKNLRDTGFTIRIPANQYNALRKAMDTEDFKRDGHLEADMQTLYAVSAPPMSFDTPTSDDGKLTLEDILASDADTSETTRGRSARATIARSLAKLDEKERIVIAGLFGLNSEPMTLNEAGAQIGVTYERARQLRDRALNRLRKLSPELALELQG